MYELGLDRLHQGKDSKRKKAHVTYRAATNRVLFGLYTLFCFTSRFNVPHHTSNAIYTHTEQIMNCFHEVNKLYDGTMNVVNHFYFPTDISSNECFTFQNAMKQEYRMLLVEAMEKYIKANEEGKHWTIDQRLSVPVAVKIIKPIWSFKRKQNPDVERLKPKPQICAHGGMYQWGESYW